MIAAANGAAQIALLSGDAGAAFSWNGQNLTSVGTIGCGEITVVDGSSINLQEALTFTGATTENKIEIPDNLANALSIQEGANLYQTFVTSDTGASVSIMQKFGLGTLIPLEPLHIESATVNEGAQFHSTTHNTLSSIPFFFTCEDDSGTLKTVSIAGKGDGSLYIRTGSEVLRGYGSIRYVIDVNGNHGYNSQTFGANMTKGLQIVSGVAPTGNITDSFAFYAADIAVGNSVPHFRTENGTVIKLNQSLLTTDNVTFGTIGCGTITTTGNIVMPDGGAIGQAAGPLLTFDDTNNYLEITGCSVGIGTAAPSFGAGNFLWN
jgi:hypothetical protein